MGVQPYPSPNPHPPAWAVKTLADLIREHGEGLLLRISLCANLFPLREEGSLLQVIK